MNIIADGALVVENPYPGSMERVHQAMKKYRDLPASFADICLLSMADNIPNSRIMTLDQDFRVYRKRNGKALDLIIPG